MLYQQETGQISTELILLIAGIMIIVILISTIYKEYLLDWSNEINNTEVQNIKNKLDNISSILKK